MRVNELIARAPDIPIRKGRAFFESCPDDHSRLEFDPYSPQHHRCPQCGRNWQGEAFDLAWVRQFQDWHAKRLVEAGILYQTTGETRYAQVVREAVLHFVRHYEEYPLAHNLLGPTRLFQSTYLESFWLVDMVAAYDLTQDSEIYSPAEHQGTRDLFYASCAIIRSFDEGVSNRQAFNNAGMGAVALLYDDDELLTHVLAGPHGFAFHMRESLLEDGLWYEGETYHFATLDHLLDFAEMARHRGIDLYSGAAGYGSLRPMFDAPLKVMLPDLTFPSRKDSWFGRGIGYHKEIYELGFARYGDERYGSLLAHAYAHDADRRELGWRGFLYCQPELPTPTEDNLLHGSCEPMPGTGVAVLRRDQGRVYASVEYGHYGGGHGHPDRLHLTLHADGVHWLVDPGTGWYHVPELSWYRSTLAHNTVSIDGHLQVPSEGELLAFGDAGDLQVAQALVDGVAEGVSIRRTLCLGDGFLVDVLDITGDAAHRYDWTIHTLADLEVETAEVVQSAPASPLGDRDGYEFLDAVTALPGENLDLTAKMHNRTLRVVQWGATKRFAARAPGIPLRESAPLTSIIARAEGHTARFATVYLWSAGQKEASFTPEGDTVVRLDVDGKHHRMLIDEQPGVLIMSEQPIKAEPRLERLAWFGRREAKLQGVNLRSERKLDAGALVHEAEGTYRVSLPHDFGEVWLEGPTVTVVEGLPQGAIADILNGPASPMPDGTPLVHKSEQLPSLRLRQASGIAVWPDMADPLMRFFAGCENSLTVVITSYDTDDAPQPYVHLPTGWTLSAMEAEHQDAESTVGRRWILHVMLPNVPEVLTGQLRIEAGGRIVTLPYRIVAPISTIWRVDSQHGAPSITLEVTDLCGRGGQVGLEIEASWLPLRITQALPTSIHLPPRGRATVHIDLPRQPLVGSRSESTSVFEEALPHGSERLWQLHGMESTSGMYPITARLRIDGFLGLTRAHLPLLWSTPAREGVSPPATAVGDMRPFSSESRSSDRTDGKTIVLGRPDQALWADRPWGGESDASARGSIGWSPEGLTLYCDVQDDVHVSAANIDDLYENDSLQVYFDFRPHHHSDRNFSPGVVGYVLAPSADKQAVRIHTIAGNREISNRGAQAAWFTVEGVEATCDPLPSGYRVQAFFPYASLGVSPLQPGDIIGFDLALSDNDGTWYRNTQLVWSGARGRRCYIRGSYHDPREFGWLIVAEAQP